MHVNYIKSKVKEPADVCGHESIIRPRYAFSLLLRLSHASRVAARTRSRTLSKLSSAGADIERKDGVAVGRRGCGVVVNHVAHLLGGIRASDYPVVAIEWRFGAREIGG